MRRHWDRQDGNNPHQFRKIPEHKVKEIFARGGMVVVHSLVGGKDQISEITRSEAIDRAMTIQEMIKTAKYPSDRVELQQLVDNFIKAIYQAKKNDGGTYKSAAVAGYVSSMDVDGALTSSSGKLIAPAHTVDKLKAPAQIDAVATSVAAPPPPKLILPE